MGLCVFGKGLVQHSKKKKRGYESSRQELRDKGEKRGSKVEREKNLHYREEAL